MFSGYIFRFAELAISVFGVMFSNVPNNIKVWIYVALGIHMILHIVCEETCSYAALRLSALGCALIDAGIAHAVWGCGGGVWLVGFLIVAGVLTHFLEIAMSCVDEIFERTAT